MFNFLLSKMGVRYTHWTDRITNWKKYIFAWGAHTFFQQDQKKELFQDEHCRYNFSDHEKCNIICQTLMVSGRLEANAGKKRVTLALPSSGVDICLYAVSVIHEKNGISIYGPLIKGIIDRSEHTCFSDKRFQILEISTGKSDTHKSISTSNIILLELCIYMSPIDPHWQRRWREKYNKWAIIYPRLRSSCAIGSRANYRCAIYRQNIVANTGWNERTSAMPFWSVEWV